MRVLESGGLGRLAPFGMHVLMPYRRWQEGTDELVQNTWGSEEAGRMDTSCRFILTSVCGGTVFFLGFITFGNLFHGHHRRAVASHREKREPSRTRRACNTSSQVKLKGLEDTGRIRGNCKRILSEPGNASTGFRCLYFCFTSRCFI